MKVADPAPWELWARSDPNLSDKSTLRFELLAAAKKWSLSMHREASSRSHLDEWDSMHLRVEPLKMRARGGCRLYQGYARVYVNHEESFERRRYTVAHELCHLFIQSVDAVQELRLSLTEEEKLCDEFANHFLVNRELLQRELSSITRFKPVTLTELASRFRVNLTPMVIALSDCWNPSWGILLLAKSRGHLNDQANVEFRVEASAAPPPMFLPKHSKLTKFGLKDAIDHLKTYDTGTNEAAGSSSSFHVRLWSPNDQKTRSGRASASVEWRALKRGKTAIFVIRPVKDDFEYHWYKRLDSKK